MDQPIVSSRTYNYWKWRIILATMACYLFYYCGRFNMSICISMIAKEFGFTNTKLGFLMSALILTYGTGQFINGNLGDRFGRILMPIGAVVSCICNWIFSFTPQISTTTASILQISSFSTVLFTTMTIVWGINGYFQAMGMAPGGRLISNWWTHKERGLAMGLYTGAAGMSNVTVFILASWLAFNYGWRAAFRYPPLLMAAVAITFYFITRDKPEDVGLESHESTKSGKHGGSMAQYAAALKNKNFMFACLSIGLHHVSRWGLLTFLPKFFTDMAGWNVKKAGFMATVLPLGMVIGALSGGYISDKIFKGKRSQIIAISLILCAIATVLIPYATIGNSDNISSEQTTVLNTSADDATVILSPAKKALVITMLLLAGYFLYVSIGPYFALCPDLLGVQNAGTGIGIMDAAAYGFAAAGTATVGILVDRYGYHSAFWFMAVCAILSSISIKMVREKYEDENVKTS